MLLATLAVCTLAQCAAYAAPAADGKQTLEIVNYTKEPLVVDGPLQVTGAGGLRLPSLSLGSNARLVIDPVRTPVSVAGVPTFAKGAKIALAKRYCNVKRGRFVLATWRGDAEVPENLFDAKSVAGKSAVGVEAAPDGKCNQLVVTVGDFESSPEVRILALGDSITEGIQKPNQKEYGHPQYRTSLAALLAANGVKAIMVGSRDMSKLDAANVQAPKGWTGHFGWSGITTDEMLGKKAKWVKAGETPDYVTLLIGTNDINRKLKNNANDRDVAAKEIFDSWKKLVNEIAARWPKAKIIGATILDRNRDFDHEGSVGRDFVVRINNIIKAELKAGNLPKNFQLVDLHEKLLMADEGVFFKDKLHPNWKGQMAMAEAFFEAMSYPVASSSDSSNEKVKGTPL